jgi:hypothetical protein
MSVPKDEMTKDHAIERALNFVLGDSKPKSEAKRGPSPKKPPSPPSKFGQRRPTSKGR